MSEQNQVINLEKYLLADVVRQIMDFRGRTPLKLGMEWGGGDIRALSANNVQMGRIDFDKEAYFGSNALYQKWMTRGECEKGDILLTTEAPLGNVAQVPDDEKYILSQRVILLKADKTKAESKFLLHLFQGELFQKELVKQSTGTTVIGIQQARLAQIKLELPSLSEQQKIAEILSTNDRTITHTEALIEKYQQIKAGLMHDLFTRGIGADGKLRPTREQAPELYRESAIGWIPKEWRAVSLSEIAEIVRGSTPRPAKDPKYFDGDFIPWITVGELSREDWPYLNDTRTMLTELGSSFSRILQSGTLVISNSGYGCGVPKILNITGCVNDGVAAFLNLDANCDRQFLYYKLYSQIMTLRTKVARGNDQPNLNTEMLGEFEIALPPLTEQEKAAERIWLIDTIIENEKVVLEKLKKQKSGLMHDLLTGKVQVTIEEAA